MLKKQDISLFSEHGVEVSD